MSVWLAQMAQLEGVHILGGVLDAEAAEHAERNEVLVDDQGRGEQGVGEGVGQP